MGEKSVNCLSPGGHLGSRRFQSLPFIEGPVEKLHLFRVDGAYVMIPEHRVQWGWG